MSRLQTASSETLGEVVKSLRLAARENQSVFADRFGYSRTHITEIENNKLSGERLRPSLIKQFPAARKRIESAVDRVEPRPRRDRSLAALRREVERLVDNGQLEAAAHALLPYARRPLPRAWRPADQFWLLDQLYQLLTAIGGAAQPALVMALSTAKREGLKNEMFMCYRRLATDILRDGSVDRAIQTLDEVLRSHPDRAELWLLRGEALWIRQDYGNAFASLTAATNSRAPKLEVLRLRTQVFAEWGHFEGAIADADAFLMERGHLSVDTATVLSARAYAFAQLGKPGPAERDFDAAIESNRDAGLIYYRRGYFEPSELALESYRHAIACQNPALDRVRRNDALERVEAIVRERGRPQGEREEKQLIEEELLENES